MLGEKKIETGCDDLRMDYVKFRADFNFELILVAALWDLIIFGK